MHNIQDQEPVSDLVQDRLSYAIKALLESKAQSYVTDAQKFRGLAAKAAQRHEWGNQKTMDEQAILALHSCRTLRDLARELETKR